MRPDKTGTITEGRLRLAHRFAVPGVTESRLLTVAACASRHETGDPMDTAILNASPATGAAALASFPFTEDASAKPAWCARAIAC